MAKDQSKRINDMASLNSALLGLNEERAVFCLKALMLSGHVPPHTMKAVLALADTVKFNDDPTNGAA